ncbi:MAG: type IV pilus modification PilV family protein [Syntrophaceae bacterium]
MCQVLSEKVMGRDNIKVQRSKGSRVQGRDPVSQFSSPVPWTLYPGPFAKRTASRQGFTLLEVMIAMAILATVLVTVFHSQSQSIAMANESRAMTSLALLAQSRMAEVEGQQNLSTGQTSGKFGDDFPDYSWTVGITQPPGPGSSYLRKIEVTVIHDYYPNRPYKVILYRPITLTQ